MFINLLYSLMAALAIALSIGIAIRYSVKRVKYSLQTEAGYPLAFYTDLDAMLKDGIHLMEQNPQLRLKARIDTT